MLNNFRNLNSLIWSHGGQWLMFRVSYALRKQTGLIRRQMPQYQWADRPLATWLRKNVPSTPQSYFEWRKKNSPKFFFNSPLSDRRGQDALRTADWSEGPWDSQTATAEADRILSGELQYFSHTWHKVGFPPDWHADPVTGIRLDSQKHWSELSDDAELDIKFIWEPSRFAMVYTLVRAYASTRDEKYAAAFWDLIDSWAESNPPNTGPNWMDGQEAALRLLAWTFGFYAFFESPSTTPERVARFVVMVAAHAERIYKNIDYAISTHSNHTISEAFGLWSAGLLFPELKESNKYFDLGKKLLEQEAVAQIFPDGGYSMYSLNYHRFILHLYLCAIRLAELNQSPVSSLLINRVSASIDYLSHLIDPETGKMPVYGSNDGALVLPLNTCDFTDYRPLLQLGSYITRKVTMFEPGPWDEDLNWLSSTNTLTPAPLSLKHSSFPHAGTHLLHGPHSRAVLRCTDHRSRPSHADQLHMDLWMHGHHIAIDPGTYLYSGTEPWRNGLAHTSVHNTVTVDHLDQMKMLTRFTWTNWSHGKVLRHEESLWQGEHNGYRRLPDPVDHKRTVMSLGQDRWLVIDHLRAGSPHHYALHWLLNDFPVQQKENVLFLSAASTKLQVEVGLLDGKADLSIVRADPHSTRGWRSHYYGVKEPAVSVMLETDQPQALFWTFFGLESDIIHLDGNILKVNSQEIDLSTLNQK